MKSLRVKGGTMSAISKKTGGIKFRYVERKLKEVRDHGPLEGEGLLNRQGRTV